LGVLDASEIPPTFGFDADRVQGIIAGGARALHTSLEGAEDLASGGAQAVTERGARSGDVVCGIAASGRTPFVLGALAPAREVGARTILLTCNPERIRSPQPWDVEIDLPTGPELVTGSTRLKAGTATKLVLNMLTTGTMVQLGKTYGNLMVDLKATNAKLVARTRRIVAMLTGLTEEQAEQQLARCDGELKTAVVAHRHSVSAEVARELLQRGGGQLRRALEWPDFQTGERGGVSPPVSS
jgi:N-acetylmuramic acid 6-phosphate etherase